MSKYMFKIKYLNPYTRSFIIVLVISAFIIFKPINYIKKDTLKNIPNIHVTIQEKESINRLKINNVVLLTNNFDLSLVEEESNYDQIQAKIVSDKIVNLYQTNLPDEFLVKDARNSYELLTLNQKTYVYNIDLLIIMEEKIYNQARATEVSNLINNLDSSSSKDQVETVRKVYELLSDEQKSMVINIFVLLDIEARIRDELMVKEIIKSIDSIPSVITLENKYLIDSIRNEYETLSESHKGLIINFDKLISSEIIIKELFDISVVNELINEIPNDITLDNKSLIEDVRRYYNALNEGQKASIHNYDKLTSSEDIINELIEIDQLNDLIKNIPDEISLESKSQVEQARRIYNNISPKYQKEIIDSLNRLEYAEVKIYNLERAKTVYDLIASLPSNVKLEKKNQIEEINKEYNKLNEEQKSYVNNYSNLETANNEIYDQEKALSISNMINSLPNEITISDKNQVESIKKYYDTLTENQKNYVSNIDKLSAAIDSINSIEQVNYVIGLINNIPNKVTIEDSEKIDFAKNSYNLLSRQQKEEVTNITLLFSAESQILDIKLKYYYRFQIIFVIVIIIVLIIIRNTLIKIVKKIFIRLNIRRMFTNL